MLIKALIQLIDLFLALLLWADRKKMSFLTDFIVCCFSRTQAVY